MANYQNPYMPAPWSQTAPTPTYTTGNSYYQQPYTAPAQMPYQSQQMMPQQNYAYANSVNNKNIIWVAGQAGAEAYQMEPGSRAVLLDSKDQVFYMMAFKYEPLNLNMQNESSQTAPAIDTSNFATKEDLDEILTYVKQLANRNGQSQNVKGSNKNV